ncbi:MAG: hypothetical protein C0409_05810, partial [Novosphingobium sp.]|nr:hypothetical protein [Novosphingobium sp.]
MRATATSHTADDAGRGSATRSVELIAMAEQADPAIVRRHLAIAREVYAERRRRHKFLPADLF